MTYNIEIMAAIAERMYQVHVEREHGQAGIAQLQVVLATVKRVYEIRSPLSFGEGLVVLAGLDTSTRVLDETSCSPLANATDISRLPRGAIVEVLASGELRARSLGAADSLQTICSSAIVYAYGTQVNDGAEVIVLPTAPVSIPNPNGYPSALAVPTFWELEDSLEFYRTHVASRSTCKVLKTAWADDGDDRRLAFVNHPESIMRESLAQHLRSSLRDHQAIRVNEEQNQSETEPVDIEVTWSLTTHIALIEIKWLGKCLNADGSDLASYAYTDARAREGVPQLVGYLEDAYERNPGHEVKGYLAVFDGRRRGVTSWTPGQVSSGDAWHYEGRDIDYQDVVPNREDFRAPVRFFVEPRVPRPAAS
jgi:hypothetical protein